jgi:hypothetical protein
MLRRNTVLNVNIRKKGYLSARPPPASQPPSLPGLAESHRSPLSADFFSGLLNHQEAQLWLERAVAQGIVDAEADLAALASRKLGSSTGEIQNDAFEANEAPNPYRLQ